MSVVEIIRLPKDGDTGEVITPPEDQFNNRTHEIEFPTPVLLESTEPERGTRLCKTLHINRRVRFWDYDHNDGADGHVFMQLTDDEFPGDYVVVANSLHAIASGTLADCIAFIQAAISKSQEASLINEIPF